MLHLKQKELEFKMGKIKELKKQNAAIREYFQSEEHIHEKMVIAENRVKE